MDVKESVLEKKENFSFDNEKLMLLLVLENGEVSWVMTDNYTFEQKKVFNRVNMVLGRPSIVLRICMTIELTLIYISSSISSLFKSRK